jgi:hypothetical protein
VEAPTPLPGCERLRTLKNLLITRGRDAQNGDRRGRAAFVNGEESPCLKRGCRPGAEY